MCCQLCVYQVCVQQQAEESSSCVAGKLLYCLLTAIETGIGCQQGYNTPCPEAVLDLQEHVDARFPPASGASDR